MDVVLVSIAGLSLFVAIAMGAILFTVLREDRRRSDARIAALAAASAKFDLPLAVSEREAAREPEPIVVRSGELFAVGAESSPWASRFGVAAVLALVIAAAGYVLLPARMAAPAAAATGRGATAAGAPDADPHTAALRPDDQRHGVQPARRRAGLAGVRGRDSLRPRRQFPDERPGAARLHDHCSGPGIPLRCQRSSQRDGGPLSSRVPQPPTAPSSPTSIAGRTAPRHGTHPHGARHGFSEAHRRSRLRGRRHDAGGDVRAGAARLRRAGAIPLPLRGRADQRHRDRE